MPYTAFSELQSPEIPGDRCDINSTEAKGRVTRKGKTVGPGQLTFLIWADIRSCGIFFNVDIPMSSSLKRAHERANIPNVRPVVTL